MLTSTVALFATLAGLEIIVAFALFHQEEASRLVHSHARLSKRVPPTLRDDHEL
ncbi:MAG: hypothetical protein ABI222_05360 [Opitutaceae bacterium]